MRISRNFGRAAPGLRAALRTSARFRHRGVPVSRRVDCPGTANSKGSWQTLCVCG